MGRSKIIFGNQTLLDLTNDTVTASDLKRGVTAHGADGELITGELNTDDVILPIFINGWMSESVSILPNEFYMGSAVVWYGKIELLGGNPVPDMRLEWDGSKWTDVSDMPYRFYNGSAVIYGDEVHILGGAESPRDHYNYQTFLGSIQIDYDGYGNRIVTTTPTTWKWREYSSLPYDFSLGSAVVYNDEIHILGGEDYEDAHAKWNNNNYQWEEASILPFNFFEGAAVVYNDEIHILGGRRNRTAHYKWNEEDGWSEVSTLPYDFFRGSAIVYDDEIHLLGGNMNETAHYKWDGLNWTEDIPLPYNFYFGSAVVYNDELHLLGSQYSGVQKHYRLYKNVDYMSTPGAMWIEE